MKWSSESKTGYRNSVRVERGTTRRNNASRRKGNFAVATKQEMVELMREYVRLRIMRRELEGGPIPTIIMHEGPIDYVFQCDLDEKSSSPST
jgi:hypothetical protein